MRLRRLKQCPLCFLPRLCPPKRCLLCLLPRLRHLTSPLLLR